MTRHEKILMTKSKENYQASRGLFRTGGKYTVAIALPFSAEDKVS